MALLALGCGAARGAAEPPARALLARPDGPGAFYLVGGGEDRQALFKKFLALSGGPDAPLVVAPLAAGAPSGDRSRAALEGVGARHVTVLTGDPARLAAEREALKAAWGVWFTGGLPDKLLGAFAPYREATDAAWRAGATIGGTSAGAMAWGGRLIMRGEGSEAPTLASGLGFLPGILIDPHFSARSRFPRLYSATGETGMLGLGVDEETAAIVTMDGQLEVYGAGAVTVIRPDGEAARVMLVRSRERLDLRAWGLVK